MKNKRSRGQVLVLVALAMVVLLGFAALGIDVGYFYSVKHQLQRCADAGALAGASTFRERGTDSTDGATRTIAEARARDFSTRDQVFGYSTSQLTTSEVSVSFPTTPNLMRVRVDVQRTVPTFFARILGRGTQAIPASAVAEAFPVTQNVTCVVPWGIPVPWVDSNGNGQVDEEERGSVDWDEVSGPSTQAECDTKGGFTNWDTPTHQIVGGRTTRDNFLCQGSLQVLKIGQPSDKMDPGNFFAMDFSGIVSQCKGFNPGPGANFYYWMIEHSCDCDFSVGIGDDLPVDTKPGNMVQNTITAVAPSPYYVDPPGPADSYLPAAWSHDPAVPDSIMNRDPDAVWSASDPIDLIPGGFPTSGETEWQGTNWASSTRIVRIPIYHPDPTYKSGEYTPTSGKSSFKPLGFVGFWIQDIVYSPPNNGTVVGRFVTVGGWGKDAGGGPGEAGTPVLNIRLVE